MFGGFDLPFKSRQPSLVAKRLVVMATPTLTERTGVLTELWGNRGSTKQDNRPPPSSPPAWESHCSYAEFSSFSWIKASQFACDCWIFSHEVVFDNFVQFHSCFLGIRLAEFLIPPSLELLSHLATFKMAGSLAEVPLMAPFCGSFVPCWYKLWVSGVRKVCSPFSPVCPPWCTICHLNPVWCKESYTSAVVASNFSVHPPLLKSI